MRNLAFGLQYLFAIINKISQIVSHQWRWLSGSGVGVVVTGWCKLRVRAWVETLIKYFFSNDFISVLSGLMDFSDIVILRSRPNSCCQQNLKCFDMPLLSLGLFS